MSGKERMNSKDVLTLILLVMLSVFLFADQRIMSAILPELQSEYGITEKSLGFIGSAFILVGAFISILFGYFTDLISRKTLLILTVLIGEIPCLLTGIPFFTRTVEMFILLRILTGIGIGGIYPITFSLISDYFKEEHRATASAWVGVAWAIGMMLGPAMAGYLTEDFGWRTAFILAAAPNFLFVLLFAFIASEPQRGRKEKALAEFIRQGAEYNERVSLADFKLIFTNKTNLWTFLQGIPGTIPWGILGYWMILFFEKNRLMSKGEATTAYLLMGVGITAGSVLFAYIGERLYRKDPKRMPILGAVGILVGIVPAAVLVNIPFSDPAGSELLFLYGLAFFCGFFLSVPVANVKAILMNVNRPEHRGRVFAVFNITDNLGQGFGPALGGMLMAFGSLFTMNFSIFWWLPCGLIFFLIARHIGADREKLQKHLADRAEEMKDTV